MVLASRYRIVALLGHGGMGVVYRADDLRLGQPVALKFPKPSLARDAERLEAFYAEVRNARKVSHPNVCGVYDIGEYEGQHFLTMDFVNGEDLASLLKRIGRLPGAKALEIAHQICAGLAAAHDLGLIHRDLKPANIMIDGHGQARISDFGLATGIDEHDRAGEVAGTPLYMAPEQLAGRSASVRSDLYSVGLVLYELYTGTKAFDATSLAELRSRQRESPPTPPSQVVGDMDPAVERVILHCLESDPEARPESARHVAAALPGGDPLAAAIAAGQTPSPQMVAAAGAEGSLRPAVAWSLLGSFAVFLTLCLALAESTSLLGVARPAKGPDALAERARDVVAGAGYEEPPTDTAYWMRADTKRLEEWISRPRGNATDQGSSRAALVRFTYRQSPEPLVSLDPRRRPSVHNPPMDLPGMVTVELDSDGRLLYFEAVPLAGQATLEAAEPDWDAMLSLSWEDISDLEPVAPSRLPPVAFDARRAWRETPNPASSPAAEVHAASLDGRPVLFEIVPPSGVASETRHVSGTRRRNVIGAVWVGLYFCWLLGSIYFARRNLRLGRGDTHGALRLALLYTVAMAGSKLLLAHYSYGSPMDFLRWFNAIAGSAVLTGVLVWLLYVALEPYARRHWPRLMIGSSRVLAGRFRDPLVGTDVLTGAVAACTGAVLWIAIGTACDWLAGRHTAPRFAGLEALLGARQCLGVTLGHLQWTLVGIVMLTATLAIGRAMTGRRWPAVALVTFSVLAAFALGSASWVPTSAMLVQGIAMAAFTTFMLLRFGVLAAFTMMFMGTLLLEMPLHLDPGVWYAGTSLLTVAIVAGIAVYGFVTAFGDRPMVADAALDD